MARSARVRRRRGVVGAAAVAVATTHVAYSRMAVTDVLLTLGVTVTLALAVAGRIEWAGRRSRARRVGEVPGRRARRAARRRRAWASGGVWRARGALAMRRIRLTSPFVLIHAGAAWGDIDRVQRLAQYGWLGFEDDPATPLAFVERLWDTIGPLALVCVAALASSPLWRRDARSDLVLLSFVAAYALSLLPGRGALRPLRPPARPGAVRPRRARPVARAAAVVRRSSRSWWSVADARALTGHDPRIDAAAWIERNVPPGDRIAADPSTLPLDPPRVVRLELPGPDGPSTRGATSPRSAGRESGGSSSADGVTDRVLAAPRPLPAGGAVLPLARNAAGLRSTGPGRTTRSAWVRVYRIYP